MVQKNTLYPINQINGATCVVGVLGWPVTHTHTPLMYNAAFAALNLNWVYIPLPTAPEQIKDAVHSLKTFNFVGARVTAPHNQAIMRYLDKIDPVARNTGVVNTIAIKDGLAWGYNTDSYGFLQSLVEANFNPTGTRCLVLGAGAAARSVVFSLAQSGANTIAIYNRTVQRAAFLVEDLESTFSNVKFSFKSLSAKSLKLAQNKFDLVINTTSLGMTPSLETTPWLSDVPLPNAVICDLVYDPLQTQFLYQAEQANLKTIDGLGMFVHRGAKAFEIWTGHPAPTKVMRETLLAHL